MVEAFYAEGKQILLLSYTNRAVDEICKALSAINPSIDYIRLGSELACEETYRPHLIENVLEDCANRRAVQERIVQCRVFVGTVATLSTKGDLFRLKCFDVALVDEATQILEPQLLGLLDEELRRLGLYNLKDSLFERLYRHLTAQDEADDGCGGVAGRCHDMLRRQGRMKGRCHDMLRRQGRMNADVAQFPNRAFYGGLLEVLGLDHQRGDLKLAPCLRDHPLASVLTRRVAFL